MLSATIVALVAGGLTVSPPTGCPAAASVAAEIDRLGGTGALDEVGDAEVVVERHELRIQIRDRDGATLGSRTVAAPTDCKARAALAAVLITAWTGEWMRTNIVRQLSTVPVVALSVTSTPPAGTASHPHIEVAAFGFGIHDGDAGGWGGGAQVDARWQALGVFVVAEASADRERAIRPVTARYGFVRSGAGLCVRQQWGRGFADVGLGPEIVRYAFSGTSMARPNNVVSWQAWADLRLRVGVSFGAVSPFAYVGGSWSFVRQRLTLEDPGAEPIALSRANVAAGLGISVTLR